MRRFQVGRRRLGAHGDFPLVAYRAFDERAYAEDMVLRGEFRFGNLSRYQKHEDLNRRDQTEGLGHFQRIGRVTTVDFYSESDATVVNRPPGYFHTHVELLNPRFVLSCGTSRVNLTRFRKQFGEWVVRITEPRRFAQEISEYLETLPHEFAGGVEGCFVKYDKGGKMRRRLDSIESTTLSYSQKPLDFSAEREFRFVIIVMGLPSEHFNEDYLTIDLGRRLPYARILNA
jgi:hypothetical protein